VVALESVANRSLAAACGAVARPIRGDAALAAADLPMTFGIHCLRHTYASGLISAGLHPPVVMARLGHASIEET
jgi:integrase